MEEQFILYSWQEFDDMFEAVEKIVEKYKEIITLNEKGRLKIFDDSIRFDDWLELEFKNIEAQVPKVTKDVVVNCLLEMAANNSDSKFHLNGYKTIFEYKSSGIGTWEAENTTPENFIDDLLATKKGHIKKFIKIYQKCGNGKDYYEKPINIKKYNSMFRVSFYKWLMKQIKRNDPIGDLAYDTKYDKECPKESNNYEKWENHLRGCQACDEAVESLKDAFEEYEKEMENV